MTDLFPTRAPITTSVRLTDLREPKRNPNVMSDEDQARLVAAIRRAGFLQPILARVTDTGLEIIDGVHRFRAAREAGLTEVPVVVLDGAVADAAASALQLGMNRLRGEVQLDLAAIELGELRGLGWSDEDLVVTGFDAREIDGLLAAVAPIHDDAALDESDGLLPAPAGPDEGHYLLEVQFARAEDLRRAKRALRRAGAGDMAAGLLKLLAEDDPTPTTKKGRKTK